jgi:hypothetical protein
LFFWFAAQRLSSSSCVLSLVSPLSLFPIFSSPEESDQPTNPCNQKAMQHWISTKFKNFFPAILQSPELFERSIMAEPADTTMSDAAPYAAGRVNSNSHHGSRRTSPLRAQQFSNSHRRDHDHRTGLGNGGRPRIGSRSPVASHEEHERIVSQRRPFILTTFV